MVGSGKILREKEKNSARVCSHTHTHTQTHIPIQQLQCILHVNGFLMDYMAVIVKEDKELEVTLFL